MEGFWWDRQDEFIGEKNLAFWAYLFSKVKLRGLLQTLVPLSPNKWILCEERCGSNLGEKDFQFFHPLCYRFGIMNKINFNMYLVKV